MNETVMLLLSLSLSGSILALLLFVLKPFIKHKLSKFIQYYLWIVVLLRLVIPFSFEDCIMNNVFYSNNNTLEISNQIDAKLIEGTQENTIDSAILPNTQENITYGVYSNDVDHNRYINNLLNQFFLYIWLIGVIIVFTVKLVGYVRFLQYLKQGYRPASDEEKRMLDMILNGEKRVELIRNQFVTTPMLIGILRPCIIIPDVEFDKIQLKNILLHETSHLKRFDIGVKWLTMIATSIHWFNPLMHFIKKEVSYACELACDEAVINNLSPTEKQAYGDTLISVIAENKFSIGVLQATMCEEKKSLKERLIAIMKHDKKSKSIKIISGILLGFIVFGALYLGVGVGDDKDTSLNINTEKTSVEKLQTEGQFSQEIIDLVEDNLKIIMSSPKESSNPMDYIKAHQNEYEQIIKYSYKFENEVVLKYMLYQFERGNAEGLRGQLMMRICKDLLGQRNNVTDEYLTPTEWFNQLKIREEIILPDFSYAGTELIEKLVYETEIEKNKTVRAGFTIVAPHIFGSYEEENKLKVFTTTFSSHYRLYDKVLSNEGGAIVPVAITYIKNSDGSYSLEEYQQAMDGSYFVSSINDFCIMPVSEEKIEGLANEILKHYGDYKDIKELERENLIKHLKANNQYGVSLYQKNYKKPVELIPLT